jgi:hypothetical protein
VWQCHPATGQRFERVAEVYFFELHEGRITRAWGSRELVIKDPDGYYSRWFS